MKFLFYSNNLLFLVLFYCLLNSSILFLSYLARHINFIFHLILLNLQKYFRIYIEKLNKMSAEDYREKVSNQVKTDKVKII
jgi:hypothetical protein